MNVQRPTDIDHCSAQAKTYMKKHKNLQGYAGEVSAQFAQRSLFLELVPPHGSIQPTSSLFYGADETMVQIVKVERLLMSLCAHVISEMVVIMTEITSSSHSFLSCKDLRSVILDIFAIRRLRGCTHWPTICRKECLFRDHVYFSLQVSEFKENAKTVALCERPSLLESGCR